MAVARQLVAQGLQELLGQGATAGAELPDGVGVGHFKRLRHLPRQGLTEQRRELRRGDEVRAALRHQAELAARAGVITKIWRTTAPGP